MARNEKLAIGKISVISAAQLKDNSIATIQ